MRSLKPYMARVFAYVSFLCCLFNAFFNLRQWMILSVFAESTSHLIVFFSRNKSANSISAMTGLIFNVLLILEVILCQFVLSL